MVVHCIGSNFESYIFNIQVMDMRTELGTEFFEFSNHTKITLKSLSGI